MKRRLLAMALSLVMLVGLFPTAAMATDDPGGGNSSSVSADTSTLTTWEAVFGGDTLSTKDIGRIWTDKTVSEENITLSGDIGSSVTIDKETSADFLVGLSALGSAADITDVTKVPTDTVFVLDLSNNMWEDDQINTMIQAANEALKTLLNANPQNRVAVVGCSTQSSVLLPLEHYESSSTFLTRDNNTLKATAVVRGEIKESSFERLTNTSHKYTQHGIYTGMQLLQSEEETTATVGGTTVTRAPVMVLMAEGEAKYGSEKFIDPPEEATIEEVGQRATSRYAQSFVAAMTAAYMKEQVTAHYYGDSGQSARVYTIGVDVDECDAPALAYAYLDPAQTVPSHFSATDGDKKDPTASWALNYFKEKFNDYNTGGTAAIHTGSYDGGNLGWKETKITKNDNENVTVSKFEYNDQYYDVTDANWGTIFDQIADDVSNQAPTAPTDVTEGAEGTGGESGKLVFTDQLGKYMKVTGTPTIVFAGKKYAAKGSPETKDNVTTYTFEGTVEGNPVYGSASLSAIKLTVTNGDEGQTLVWEIPANLLPLRTVKVQGDTDEQGETSYTINLDKNAYPIRLFYSVAKEDEHNWSEADNDYLKSRSKNGQTNYYEAVWDQENGEYGTTTAVFTPAESNAFYHYTEDTILYNLVNTGNQDIYLSEEDAEAAEVTTILPGAGTVQVGGIAYRLEAAEGYVSGRAYYYQHVYYQAEDSSDTAAQKRTDYHMLQDGSRIVVGGNDSNADIDNGVLKIKAGTNKLSRVSDGDGVKVKNTTQTAGTYRHPVFELGENEKVTVYLGNNGLLKEATPTGSLTVTVGTTEGDGANSDQEFIYKLILANLNGYDTLTGEYTIKIGGESSGQKIGNNGTFKLKAGQCATIEGLPAGSVWQLQQENVPGYTPAFTGDVYQEGAQSGAILYKEKAGAATLDKNVTVTNTYNPAQVSYLLTYDGNAISGSLQAPPPQAQSVNSGASVTLPSSAPTHQDVDGKAVALIGWTETATSKIYSLADKSEFESLGEDFHEKGGNYTMPAKLTTLYAVWGYDTDEDGTADVKETTYTLTYNANGGKFTEEKETKEVTVVAQDGYKLLASGEEGLPTHAKTNWNGTETAVVFMGWSTTKLEKIYSVNDERPVTVSEIDITESETVYAVWGYDADGNGTADINDNTHKITVSTGDNGTATVEYSMDTTSTPVNALTKAGSNDYYVVDGQNLTVNITPNSGYAVDTITVDNNEYKNTAGATSPNGEGYTSNSFKSVKFEKVTAGHTISITFAPVTGDGEIPDKYNRTLTYDANGGKFGDAVTGTDTKVITGLEESKSYSLSNSPVKVDAPTHEKENGIAVLFLGWLTEDNSKKIYGAEDKEVLEQLQSKVTISSTGTTLYAAWGYSSDGTTPDVEKDTVTVTASVNGDNGSISPENKTVIKGSSVEFTITANEDYALDTIKVGSDIVLTNDGDSEYTADENRQGKWTLKNVQAGTQVVVSFAEDKDRDGIPDKNKPIEPDPQPESYALTYDTNGGFGGPGKVEVKADAAEDYTLETTNVPKHAPDEDNGTAMIFIGWTTERDTKIYSASDEKGPTTVETLTLTADDEVYAVWGYDANEDGTPDVEETDKYSLTYDTNAMEGDTVSGSVSDANKYVSKQTVALADGSGLSYQESGAENAKVMFLGWSTTKTDRIFSSSDEDKTAFAEVTIVPAVTFDSQDIEVYAVWGYDKDKDDRPDVIGEDYVIYPFAGPNGSISPDTAATVEKNGDQAFAFAPNNGYAVDRIVIDDTTYLNNGKLELEGYDTAQKTYTFSNVQDDHSIIVTFSADKDGDGIPDKYDDPEAQTCTVTASVSGAGGSIAPSGTMKVNCGESKHFTITADSGYHIADVTVNGKSVGAVSGYTLQNITENTTIVASFARNSSGTTRYTITASAGAGGKISPSGSVRVSRNSDKTFTITANEGYVISDVLVDDKSVGAVEKYTFEKVREKHTIEAVFALASGVADPEDTGVSDWLNTKDHTAYLSGYANGSFGPNKNMTRAEAAQMFYNLLLNQEVSGAVSFTDVAADAWYAKAVHTLASLGILQGVGDGRFAPDRAITRAEFTVIAMRFADLDTSGENIFTDVNAGDWFYDQVVGSIRYGWINGYEDGTFRPNNTITRAEVTTIVNRMLGRAADKDYVDSHKDQLRQFPDVAQTNWAYYNIVEATNAHDYEKSGGTEDWTGLAD